MPPKKTTEKKPRVSKKSTEKINSTGKQSTPKSQEHVQSEDRHDIGKVDPLKKANVQQTLFAHFGKKVPEKSNKDPPTAEPTPEAIEQVKSEAMEQVKSEAIEQLEAETEAMQLHSKPALVQKRKRKTYLEDSDDDFMENKEDTDEVPKPKKEKTSAVKVEKSPAKNFSYAKMINREKPKALGTRELPQGQPNCLEGYTFVLTGEMETIDRKTAADVIKRYGGRVTSAISGKTTFLVSGRDSGPTKIELANKLGLRILEEEDFYTLVETETTKGKVTSPLPNKKPTTSKAKAKASTAAVATASTSASTPTPTSTYAYASDPIHHNRINDLWTVKHSPKSSKEILGNKEMIRKISQWLEHWQENMQQNFTSKSNDGLSAYRSVIISGPPGIGKTTSSHLIAKECGYEAVEYNASDARSKKTLEKLVTETVRNHSVTEFFCYKNTPQEAKNTHSTMPNNGKKIVLIMDEVDGMSAGDRGGAVELASIIRKTKIPIICICNDIRSAKVQPLVRVCFDAKFRRTPSASLRNRILDICRKEDLDILPNAVDALVESTRNDIRQIINILSTYRVTGTSLDYDQAKSLGSINQKKSQMSLFDIPPALFSGSNWRSTTLAEKADVYFHDYSLSPLMIFENYLKVKPEQVSQRSTNSSIRNEECTQLELTAKAADAIADGDLVDAIIHGTMQNYSLMPYHSIASCVRPASFVRGILGGARLEFPKWLGQNSKRQKNQRLLKDIQGRIRSKTPVNKSEVQGHYIPLLSKQIFHRIENEDFDVAIEIMDTYCLNIESLETLSDFSMDAKKPMSTLPTKLKKAFEKYYDSKSHPILFQDTGAPIKKVYIQMPVGNEADTLFEDADEEEENSSNEDEIDEDIKKDKFIKIGKTKSNIKRVKKGRVTKA
ncbi:replication factor RFC1 C terminal domain-containing protein [Spinellus fusiger]|nr:replication factor RFC1 C terminal domain-containing protein [Spinellus fusiger]